MWVFWAAVATLFLVVHLPPDKILDAALLMFDQSELAKDIAWRIAPGADVAECDPHPIPLT
jgi:hypothetical protein